MSIESAGSPTLWMAFSLLVLLMLGIELGVAARGPQRANARTALLWSGLWIGVALLFAAGIYLSAGAQPSIEFITAYFLEKSLAVDNLFVIALICSHAGLRPESEHRVLFYGVFGAMLLRGVLIALGAALLARFHWLLLLFGAFVMLVGWRMLRGQTPAQHSSERLVGWLTRRLPFTAEADARRFIVRAPIGARGRVRWLVTPLFIALCAVELADVVFAVDSIPAVFGITADPFLVYTSNILAVMGLRALYFALTGVLSRLTHFRHALAVVLLFIGAKTAAEGFGFELSAITSLAVTLTILGAGIGFSLARRRRLLRSLARAPGRRGARLRLL